MSPQDLLIQLIIIKAFISPTHHILNCLKTKRLSTGIVMIQRMFAHSQIMLSLLLPQLLPFFIKNRSLLNQHPLRKSRQVHIRMIKRNEPGPNKHKKKCMSPCASTLQIWIKPTNKMQANHYFILKPSPVLSSNQINIFSN